MHKIVFENLGIFFIKIIFVYDALIGIGLLFYVFDILFKKY